MHEEKLKKNKVRLVSFISLLLGFLDAFFIYILSTYFSDIAQSESVGIFYFVAYSGVFVCLFFLQPLIRRVGRAHALYLSLGVSICASALLASVSAPLLAIGAALLLIIATNVTIQNDAKTI